MSEREAASEAVYRRVSQKRVDHRAQRQVIDARTNCWARIPEDLAVLVCQCLGPRTVVELCAVRHAEHHLGLLNEVWQFFCTAQWGKLANLNNYASPRELYCDRNGWFPRLRSVTYMPQVPEFSVQQVTIQDPPCTTLDLRTMADGAIVAVSEGSSGNGRYPGILQIVDPGSERPRECIDILKASINCCDVAPGLICVGGADAKVRIYNRSGLSSSTSSEGSVFRLAGEYNCSSEVNDLRLTVEGTVVTVRTQHNRQPAGLDLIPLARPDARVSFSAGSLQMRGLCIHAIDGFDEGCSLSSMIGSGESPSGGFSAMLLDFRCSTPAVLSVPVPSQAWGHTADAMLWPLRGGRTRTAYAHLLQCGEGGEYCSQGSIATIDFRLPVSDIFSDRIELPEPVDDFRYFDGSIYAACTNATTLAQSRKLQLFRYILGASKPGAECLWHGSRAGSQGLKVLSVSQRGFVVSHEEHMTHGTIRQPC